MYEKYSHGNVLKINSVNQYFYTWCIISIRSPLQVTIDITFHFFQGKKTFKIVFHVQVIIERTFQPFWKNNEKCFSRTSDYWNHIPSFSGNTLKIVFLVQVIIERTFQSFWKNNEYCISSYKCLLRKHCSNTTENCFLCTSDLLREHDRLSEEILTIVFLLQMIIERVFLKEYWIMFFSSYKWLLREHFNLSQRWMENYFVKFVILYFCKFNLISVCWI